VYAGYKTAPEDTRLPVMLSDGEVILQPCYVAVDGECVALVKDEAVAAEVVARVKDEYKNASTVNVEIQEDTSIESMELENGDDKPELLTAAEASKQIVDKQSITVKTTEMVEEQEFVAYKTIEKVSEQIDPGKVEVQQQGRRGINRVTKKVIKENGKVISETVIERETVRKCIPEIMIYGEAGMSAPLDTMCLTSPFGYRWGRQHEGIDLGLPEGSPIYAAKSGIVTFAAYTAGYGNLVKLDHGNGLETYYAHCSRLDVTEGRQVEAGDQIAAVGSTGNSTGPHLHFEVRQDGIAQDPAAWLDME
jgi:hypothetical protein